MIIKSRRLNGQGMYHAWEDEKSVENIDCKTWREATTQKA